ncbi:hypothetical protein [Patiriisocius marinus]|uniref:Uncharacterized protein n=1 Tax=Patiriisocius marinus TaxID=1397112 RepID=A0A5J4IWS1_9FLAO|nr:hypothetical protein [Patiriisocius marinus]GER57988.1 hypothetical protein ULMA_00960 [Patiriisocius marinus]
MKNIFKVIAVAAVFLLGMQNTTAQTLSQDQDRPEVIAKQKTSDLSDALNLTGDQQRYIFRALTAKEVNYRKHINGKDATNPEVIANKKKYDDLLVKSMKKTLTAEQFTAWEAMQ